MSGSEAPPSSGGGSSAPFIGVLALQGAFQEHAKILQELGVRTREVRLPEELEGLDGLIMPGGESTAMAIVGEQHGVFPRLKAFIASGKPVWGTCAGMILLSDKAVMQKDGGQALVGGLDVEVCRNYFGSQIDSFEVALQLEGAAKEGLLGKGAAAGDGGAAGAAGPVTAVFIRAPAILEAGPEVQILAKVQARPCAAAKATVEGVYEQQQRDNTAAQGRVCLRKGADGLVEVVVAVRQGNILATAFHPELTTERWWHQYFVSLCR